MEAQNNVTKVKFKKLIHSYKDFLVNKFDDGQVWCLDKSQFYQ